MICKRLGLPALLLLLDIVRCGSYGVFEKQQAPDRVVSEVIVVEQCVILRRDSVRPLGMMYYLRSDGLKVLGAGPVRLVWLCVVPSAGSSAKRNWCMF